ncbi:MULTISPECIES: translesion error-prone DNA polymerase V autoproteolytic subunit [unclassified Arthrobacter]|uniref:LexA family protein n=1 Tax=unclassified Arthrobacter TaxID=235627 RepID=UPI00254DC940|nr:translesion error-prone DNA polymerase V autoproteolytic subunit [Arthrobacter sp. efr-133-TYG-120]
MSLALDPRMIKAGAEPGHIPVAPVAVPAGYPSPSQDYFSSELDLNEHLIKDKTSTYIVRVAGNSMEPAGISDGDELIVNRALAPKDGSVVVAILDDELTIKRLRITRAGIILQSDNPDYPPIRVPELSDLRIWGVVTWCLHHV